MSPIAQVATIRLQWQTVRRALVVTLLATYYLVAVASVSNKSITYDELAHVTAGCAYWQFNDYRLQPENGNLPQRWCALPIVLTGKANLPAVDHPAWKTADVWTLGDAFLYRLGNDARQIIWLGRSFAALWGVGICLVVYAWSRSLFGDAGGLISLLTCGWCPTLLAQGPLMTSDACLAFFLTLSVWLIWQLLQEVTRVRLALATVAIAGLFLAKLSAVLILPMAAILIVVRCFSKRPIIVYQGTQQKLLTTFAERAKAIGEMGLVAAVVAFAAVWIAYGCRYDGFNTANLPAGTYYKLGTLETAVTKMPPKSQSVVKLLAARNVLPEPYLYGSAFIAAHRKRLSFFNGEYSVTGWKSYFPYCLLVKTPLAMFALLILSVSALCFVQPASQLNEESGQPCEESARPAPWWYRLLPLVVLLGVYWAVSLMSSLNIGQRHLLPTYPAMHVLIGGVALWLTKPVGKIVVGAFVSWLVIGSALSYPNYLAYFNLLVPQETAYQHLVDSNLDWGQDLPGLQQWLSKHHPPSTDQQPAYLGYFGKGNAKYYGIEARSLNRVGKSNTAYEAGIYCVSATTLQAVYEAMPGHWNKIIEEEYQTLKQAHDTSADPHKLAYYRYLRLLVYLRHRRPDDQVGYSILIFKLSIDELQAALEGRPAELEDQPFKKRAGATP